MKVILLSPVAKLGRAGDVKEVADGYARNFLFPRKLAEVATKAGLARVEEERRKNAALEKARAEKERELLARLANHSITLFAKTKERKLFGAVHPQEIVAALAESGIVGISEKQIILDKPIKETGEYVVKARLGGKDVRFIVVVRSTERG